jgi:hypothetical protein
MHKYKVTTIINPLIAIIIIIMTNRKHIGLADAGIMEKKTVTMTTINL